MTLTELGPYSKNITFSTSSFPYADKKIGFSTSDNDTNSGWDNIVISQGSVVLRENFNNGSWDASNFEIFGSNTGSASNGVYRSTGNSRGVLRTKQDFIGSTASPVTISATLNANGWWSGLSFIALRGEARNSSSGSEPTNSLTYRLHPFNNGQTNTPGGAGDYRLTDAFYTTYPLEITIVDDGLSLNATFTQLLPPQITSAAFDGATGSLVVTGVNFYSQYGTSNDVDVSRLAIVGQAGSSYTLTSDDVELTSTTQFSINLNAADKAALRNIINANGTSADDSTSYALNASDNWLPGWHTAANIADTGNAITATNADSIAPQRSGVPSVSVDGTKLFLSFSETLSSSTASPSDFSVNVNGTNVPVHSVSISGSTVELLLAAAVQNGQAVTVSYTDPSAANDSQAVQDLAGNDAASFSSIAVPDATKPSLLTASTNASGSRILLKYDEVLSTTTASISDFSITVNGVVSTINSISIVSDRVELELAIPASYGQSIVLSYLDPSSSNDINAVQDPSGNDASTLNAITVSNSTPAPGGGSNSEESTSSRRDIKADSVQADNAPGGLSLQDVDLDGDGIREVILAGDGVSVDGNQDGIPDAEQSLVAGLRLINDGFQGSDYGALSVSPGTRINSVIVTPQAGNQPTPDGITNLFVGPVSFTVSDVEPGSSTQATIHLPSGLPAGSGNAYVRLNYSTNRFEEYVDASGAPLYSFVDNNRDGIFDAVNLTLVDGDPNWDGDGAANGTVVDPGFLAVGERTLNGTKRKDVLTGNILANTINGRKKNDWLQGGLGADVLIGGKGKDRYVYVSADESTPSARDTVRLGKKDRFVFSSFDGDSTTEGHQKLSFIGRQAFSGLAGELRASRSLLEADLNGDGISDFALNLRGGHVLERTNLLL